MLLLDILSNTAVVYRYAGWVFGVEQGKPLETIEQVRTRLDLTVQSSCQILPRRSDRCSIYRRK